MRSFCFVIVGLLTLSSLAAQGSEQSWQAGTAVVSITPKDSMWMAGYASRKAPSNGVLSELFAKALVIEDRAGKRAILITCDLVTIPRALREQVAKALAEKYDVDPAGLLLNCSHTHCGPVVRDNVETSVLYDVDSNHAQRIESYFVDLRDKLVATAGAAIAKLEPVKLGYSHARCGFAMNRRLPSAAGIQNSPYPDGLVDHDVPILRIESLTGELRAVAFGYACHNTTTALMQFNADYAGFAQTEIEAAHPGAIAMFIMGCGGDQNPYPRGKIEMARTHGKALATAVEAALLPEPVAVEGPLTFAFQEVALPFQPLTRDEILTRHTSSDNFEQRRTAELLKEFDAQGHVRVDYPYPVQVFQFGKSLTLITLGGEVVIDYSLRLKKELSGRVWIAGYSNDVMAYIPSERVLSEGGYEGGGAMRYSNLPNPWRPGIEELIVGKVRDLLIIPPQ